LLIPLSSLCIPLVHPSHAGIYILRYVYCQKMITRGRRATRPADSIKIYSYVIPPQCKRDMPVFLARRQSRKRGPPPLDVHFLFLHRNHHRGRTSNLYFATVAESSRGKNTVFDLARAPRRRRHRAVNFTRE